MVNFLKKAFSDMKETAKAQHVAQHTFITMTKA